MITPERIRAHCATLGQNTIATADLVRALGAGTPADYETVKRLARELRDCHTVGAPVTRRGRTIRPMIWHAPKPLCPCCGGSGFARTVESRLAEARLEGLDGPAAAELQEQADAEAWEVSETYPQRLARMAAEAEARVIAEENGE